MGQHGALGRTGGAAGILQDGDVRFRGDGHRRHAAAVAGQGGEGKVRFVVGDGGKLASLEDGKKHALQGRQDVAHGADDDFLQAGGLQKPGHLGINLLQVQGDHDADNRILHLISHFVTGVEGVEIDHRSAGLEDGVIADDEIGGVGQAQADPDSPADAQVLKPPGRPVHQVEGFRVCVPAAEEIQARAIGETFGRTLHQPEHGTGSDGSFPGDGFRICPQPGVVGLGALEMTHKALTFSRVRPSTREAAKANTASWVSPMSSFRMPWRLAGTMWMVLSREPSFW